MTVKAGQKCTAIRRAFVPAGLLDTVTEAVSARLAQVVDGAPGAKGVTMGALVSLSQRADVRERVAGLQKAAELVYSLLAEFSLGGDQSANFEREA